MIKVLVFKQSNYPVSKVLLRNKIKDFLSQQGIVSDVEVSVSVIGEKRMKDLGKTYLGEENKPAHSVLSFPFLETDYKFVDPPDGVIRLGEIAICYPVAANQANEESKLIEEKVIELACHGALHLLGIHHE